MRPTRRAVLAAALAAPPLATRAAADEFRPTRPVRFVVPFPPGSSNDTLGRALTQAMAARVGQPIIVDNRPGAGGTIGADMVAKAAADGHTLLNGTNAIVTIAPHLIRVPYDPLTDLAPVAQVGEGSGVLAVAPSLGVASVAELVALLRQRPGMLNYGSAGNGTNSHIWGELFQRLTGTRMEHVPFRGGADAVRELIAGRIQMTFDVTALDQVRAGTLRGLAVTADDRWPSVPDIPTMAEAGVAGFRGTLWWALFAPPGTPQPSIAYWHAQLQEVLAAPEMQQRLTDLGIRPRTATTAALAQRVRDDHAFFGEFIRDANLRSE